MTDTQTNQIPQALSQDSRSAIGRRASVVCIICNLALAAAKALAGLAAGSVAVVADAVNNLSDASSNVISLVGFQLAAQPADSEHPYGHGRYEYVAGLVVALLVMAMGLEILRTSVEKLIHPTATTFSVLTTVSLTVSIAVKLWMMHFTSSVGKRIASETLSAAAIDSRNDALTTASIGLAATLSHISHINLDGWVGLGMAVFVLISGARLVKETIDPLLGRAPSAEKVEYIRRRILAYPGVLATHDLMVHDYGPGRQFASAHVEMAAERNPLETHHILDTIEQDFLMKDGLHLVLHYDPISTGEGKTPDLYHAISQRIRSIDPRLTIHDLRVEGVEGSLQDNFELSTAQRQGVTISFDCTRPSGLPLSNGELRKEIEQVLRPIVGNSALHITVDEGYLNIADTPHC